MRAHLEALIHELKELKRQRVDGVYLSDGTMDRLREVVQKLAAASPAGAREGASPSSSASLPPSGTSVTAEEALTLLGMANPASSTSTSSSPSSPTPSSSPIRAVPVAATGSTEGIAIASPPQFELPVGSKRAQWEWLRDRVLNCPECNRHVAEGKKVVFGVGSLDAKIFFCGEAPGADEEIEGEPFVGKAGQLLTRIIKAMGLDRSEVYIGNIMNWRPETGSQVGNRAPTTEEMAFCLPYLRAQLAIVNPEVIVALGRTAIDGLLGHDPRRRIGDVRGHWQEFEGKPLMPTFHPSYLLRNDTNRTKRQVWEDMLQVMERLKMPISEKQRGYFL